jgi:hypothetical protein
MYNCSTCDKSFSSKGIKNHEQACQGKLKLPDRNNSITSISQLLWKVAGYIKLSWFIPDYNMGSLLYYFFIVYPLMYIVGYRMFFTPIWEILSGLLVFARYIASLYDRFGVTPNGVPHDASYEASLKTGAFGVFIHLLNQTAFILNQKVV